jgi:Bacterial Ig domain
MHKIAIAALLVGSIHAADTIRISSPANGATVASPAALRITISPAAPRVTVYLDNRRIGNVYTSTASFSKSLTLTNGSHHIRTFAVWKGNIKSSADSTFTVASSSGGGGGGGSTPTPGFAAQIYNDMTGGNEGYPQGAPAGWYGPSIGEGNNISPNTAAVFWGALFVGPNGNPATNTLVNIRNCSFYWLSASTGKWSSTVLTPDQIGSDFYSEDFSIDYLTSVPTRIESDGSFSISTSAGKIAHFYGPYPRIPIDPNDLAGVVVLLEARLILNSASGPDDRSSASFLLMSGADPYPATTGDGIENNPNIVMGQFKYVKTSWRSFCATSMTLAQLTNNPPPVNLTGILP